MHGKECVSGKEAEDDVFIPGITEVVNTIGHVNQVDQAMQVVTTPLFQIV